MGTLLESKLTTQQHALIKKVLVAQTESFGVIEAPIVEELLRKRKCRSALDIGCGEGSFLLELARRVKGTRFLGIDHSDLAVNDALRRLGGRSWRNVTFKTAFFGPSYERAKYDAILTRYTVQHCSKPEAFVNAVFDRLKKQGTFIAIESLDAHNDCQEKDPVWERYRRSVAAIHQRAGSNPNIGQSLGRLLKAAGFREIVVRVMLCSPSTVGWKRFRTVVLAGAEIAFGLFPDLFDRSLRDDLKKWLGDRTELERKDPYMCTAIASGTKP